MLITPETRAALAAAAKLLEEKNNRFSLELRELEEDFEDMNVGVRVWLPEPLGETGYQLGYTKIAGKWRISVQNPDLKQPLPLDSASRVARMVAKGYLEKLALAILATLEEYADYP